MGRKLQERLTAAERKNAALTLELKQLKANAQPAPQPSLKPVYKGQAAKSALKVTAPEFKLNSVVRQTIHSQRVMNNVTMPASRVNTIPQATVPNRFMHLAGDRAVSNRALSRFRRASLTILRLDQME